MVGRDPQRRRSGAVGTRARVSLRRGLRIGRRATHPGLSPHDVPRELWRKHVGLRAKSVRWRNPRAERGRSPAAPCPPRRGRSPADIPVADTPVDPRPGVGSAWNPPPAFSPVHPTAVVERHPAPGVVAHPRPVVVVSPLSGAHVRLEVGPDRVRIGNPNQAVRRIVHPFAVRIEDVPKRGESARILVRIATTSRRRRRRPLGGRRGRLRRRGRRLVLGRGR